MTSSLAQNLPPPCSTEHYKSPKLNSKACDSCWLAIGIHRKKYPPWVHDMHLLCRTRHEGNSGCEEEEKAKRCIWQHSGKVWCELDKYKIHCLYRVGTESIPPKLNCSCTEHSIHKLSILSCLKGILSTKRSKVTQFWKERQHIWKIPLGEGYI